MFYCGLQEWDSESGWKWDHRPALYLAGYFEVSLAGMAGDFDKRVLKTEFGKNFHVRYPTVFEQQKDDLVLVKGGPGSRLFNKARQISVVGNDRSGKPLKVLSPAMQKVFGTFRRPRLDPAESTPLDRGLFRGHGDWLSEGTGVDQQGKNQRMALMRSYTFPAL